MKKLVFILFALVVFAAAPAFAGEISKEQGSSHAMQMAAASSKSESYLPADGNKFWSQAQANVQMASINNLDPAQVDDINAVESARKELSYTETLYVEAQLAKMKIAADTDAFVQTGGNVYELLTACTTEGEASAVAICTTLWPVAAVATVIDGIVLTGKAVYHIAAAPIRAAL